MADVKTFSISDLSSINNIDHEDLLLVSDYENGKCYTRKMNIEKLMQTVVDDTIVSAAVLDNTTAIGNSIQTLISSSIVNKVAEEVSKQLSNDITQKVLKIILDNSAEVRNRLDGTIEDNEYVIDGTFHDN